MGQILERSLIANYTEIEKELRKLHFSAYESAVYVALLGKNEIAVTEISERCRGLGRPVPTTKVYSVLGNLERRGLVEKFDQPLRYRVRFGMTQLANYVEELTKEKIEKIEQEKNYTLSKLQNIWDTTLEPIRKKNDIWRIYSTDEAKKISLSICKNAKKEIRIMTEHGGWIYDDPEFRSVLEDKSKKDKIKVWALIAEKKFIKEGKNKDWENFKGFLDHNKKIRYYFYKPHTLRMTIVDKKESLFFMYKDPEQKDVPIIYYTTLQDVSYSLARFFSMECLFEYTNKLQSFIDSDTGNEKFCDLRNLLFD
jgi:sugar-specific transcriptional regulator TrmB